MNAFLAEAAITYRNLLCSPNVYKRLKIVLGNESCDPDSAISALVYGFSLHHQAIQENNNVAVLPLLNIPSNDLVLKTEVTYFLEKCGIDLHLVPTRGISGLLNLKKLNDAGCLELTLVDHHVLPPQDEGLKSSVVEVIDHRPKDPNWHWNEISNVTIENVGSCCTLIANKINQDNPHLLTKEISQLLLGPIIVDTANLLESAGRTSPLDLAMVALLEANVSIDRNQLYKEILHAKADIEKLQTSQVFRKDLKFVMGIPIIGVPTLIQEFRKRKDFESSLSDFAKAPVIILMGVKATENSISRDLGVYIKDMEIGTAILDSFVNSSEPNFELKTIEENPMKSLKLYNQGNVKATRKQISPIVTKVISNFKISN